MGGKSFSLSAYEFFRGTGGPPVFIELKTRAAARATEKFARSPTGNAKRIATDEHE
jgi:hypothetical protein